MTASHDREHSNNFLSKVYDMDSKRKVFFTVVVGIGCPVIKYGCAVIYVNNFFSTPLFINVILSSTSGTLRHLLDFCP
jgi:hypothetical protein